jgi:hypothetical protein
MTTTLLYAHPAQLIDDSAHRIGDYLDTFDVTDSLVIAVESDTKTVLECLGLLNLIGPAVQALESIGIADRLTLAPTLLAAPGGEGLVFGLVWRVEQTAAAEEIDPSDFEAFDTPGYVKVIWDVQVTPSEGERAFLSTTTRFAATDEVTRARLLAGWGVIGPFSKSLSRRTLAAIRAYAEDWDELAA